MAEDVRAEDAQPADEARHADAVDVATFRLVCAGRDGRLVLFEDADGHLTAVRSTRLA